LQQLDEAEGQAFENLSFDGDEFADKNPGMRKLLHGLPPEARGGREKGK